MNTTSESATCAKANPLINPDDPNETRFNVACAIEFLADAIGGLESVGNLTTRTAQGMGLLLGACAGALGYEYEKPKKA